MTGYRSIYGDGEDARLREVDARVEDVRLFALRILRQDNREPFLLFPILAIEETDRSLALLVLCVADAASISLLPNQPTSFALWNRSPAPLARSSQW